MLWTEKREEKTEKTLFCTFFGRFLPTETGYFWVGYWVSFSVTEIWNRLNIFRSIFISLSPAPVTPIYLYRTLENTTEIDRNVRQKRRTDRAISESVHTTLTSTCTPNPSKSRPFGCLCWEVDRESNRQVFGFGLGSSRCIKTKRTETDLHFDKKKTTESLSFSGHNTETVAYPLLWSWFWFVFSFSLNSGSVSVLKSINSSTLSSYDSGHKVNVNMSLSLSNPFVDSLDDRPCLACVGSFCDRVVFRGLCTFHPVHVSHASTGNIWIYYQVLIFGSCDTHQIPPSRNKNRKTSKFASLKISTCPHEHCTRGTRRWRDFWRASCSSRDAGIDRISCGGVVA